MRYLSLFDGIGAASVAWEPLGWECVGVSEVDPFPIAVTKHHRPDVPHLGDVTKITEQQIAALGRIDLIVGGFPCQDLSVAGKRAGLRNDDGTVTRSGLFFDAMGLVQWARKHCGLRWVLIENVPGLFSSNSGRDFAAVVGAIVGTEFDVPRDGWRNSGAAVGPEGLAEWSTLDAQFFGLAQRRKRVFLVGNFGEWQRAEPVFSFAEGMSGHLAPRREKRQSVTGTVEASLGRSRGAGTPVPSLVHTFSTSAIGDIRQSESASTITRNTGGGGETQNPAFIAEVTHSLRADGFDASEDGTNGGGYGNAHDGLGISIDHSPPMARSQVAAVAFAQNNSHAVETDVAATITKLGVSGTKGGLGAETLIGAAIGMQVRRLTPRECERLQGFPDDYTLIPYRNKPAADGPRYKALGNSMAVPCMAWIGRRIAEVDAISSARSVA